MKKIIFVFICFFVSINFVNAISLSSENTKFYVKISHWSFDELIINVKKIYDQDSLNVLFNIDINNYEVNENFNKYDEHSLNIWKVQKSLIPYFCTIVYYGYLNNPTVENYVFTQIMVWSLISNYTVKITDELGNEIKDFQKDYNNLYYKVSKHITESPFFYTLHNREIWTTNEYTYLGGVPILNEPLVEGLDIKTNNNIINIYNDKVGNYKLLFKKEYEHEIYCYSDGINTYLQSLKGPGNIEYDVIYNVYGTKFNIKENLIGINNRYGDAKLNSNYELYLGNELKLIINNLEDNYVKSNTRYILKDISNNNGINNTDDIVFNVENEDYTLTINKYVISKNFNLDIKDNNTYYIYLKSNNELYEIVNKDSLVITLPYGIYYIKNEDNSYYQEIKVKDNLEDKIVIDPIEDNEKNDIEKEENKNSKEEIKETNKEYDKIQNEDKLKDENNIIDNIEDKYIEDIKINNPETLDNINFYIITFIISLIPIIYLKYLLKKEVII